MSINQLNKKLDSDYKLYWFAREENLSSLVLKKDSEIIATTSGETDETAVSAMKDYLVENELLGWP